MNYYERIQQSIDFIETNICEDFTLEDCAKEAYMSVAGYYRFFFSIVGMNVKEYIRERRLSCAINDLACGDGVLETAIKYGYHSADGFSRSFKKKFGFLPSQVSSKSLHNTNCILERIDIMNTMFENDELAEQYPDIKVVKDLPAMKVACFSYFGRNPEDHAFEELRKWFKDNEITLYGTSYRLFGYNNPDPAEGAVEYAYEYCITIPDELFDKLEDVPSQMREVTYPKVYRKILPGGKYAVMSIKREGKELGERIMEAWPRLVKWLDASKYMWGTKQYLEEHIGFSEEDDHIGGVDLYISIAEDKNNAVNMITEVQKGCERVIIFRKEGTDFAEINSECWKQAMSWAVSSGIDPNECTIYQYNQGFSTPKVLFNVVMLTIPKDMDIPDAKNGEYILDVLEEGKYVCLTSSWGESEGLAWETLGKWCKKNKVNGTKRQWLEEIEHNGWNITGSIKCLLPL